MGNCCIPAHQQDPNFTDVNKTKLDDKTDNDKKGNKYEKDPTVEKNIATANATANATEQNISAGKQTL